MYLQGVWWLSGKFSAFRPKGHRFESYSSHPVGTLGKPFTCSCLYNVMWHLALQLNSAPLITCYPPLILCLQFITASVTLLGLSKIAKRLTRVTAEGSI